MIEILMVKVITIKSEKKKSLTADLTFFVDQVINIGFELVTSKNVLYII